MKWKNHIESNTRSVYKNVEQYFSTQSIIHIYKSNIRPLLEYCCHTLSVATAKYLEIRDEIQKKTYKVISPGMTSRIQSLFHRRNVAYL